MTRFARAKGSKSSNEKKPEEATSWSEMKLGMPSKKARKPEEKHLPEEEKVKIDDAPNRTEWVSLGDDTFGESVSLVKQHLGQKINKINKINTSEGTRKVKKKMSNNSQSVLNSEEKLKTRKEAKKSKIILDDDEVESEVKMKKKRKKRELAETEGDSQGVIQKKKKKLLKTDGEVSASEECKIHKEDEIKNETDRKKDKKKFMKSANMKAKHVKNDKRGNFNPKMQQSKQKGGKKKFKNKNFQETKSPAEELIIINGEKIPIIKFQGFYVTVEDAERLKKLRTEMIKQGIPKAKLESAIKLERRRAEKALSRLKKSVCFHCRGHGHFLSDCPKLFEKENTATGICYKCGSTEHSATECKVVRGTNYQFAECFICKEQGHIARQCPDNPRGLYPQGGACRECGDVTHLRKDCPKIQAQKPGEVVTVGLRSDRDLECLHEEIASREKQNLKKKVKQNSTVKF